MLVVMKMATLCARISLVGKISLGTRVAHGYLCNIHIIQDIGTYFVTWVKILWGLQPFYRDILSTSLFNNYYNFKVIQKRIEHNSTVVLKSGLINAMQVRKQFIFIIYNPVQLRGAKSCTQHILRTYHYRIIYSSNKLIIINLQD